MKICKENYLKRRKKVQIKKKLLKKLQKIKKNYCECQENTKKIFIIAIRANNQKEEDVNKKRTRTNWRANPNARWRHMNLQCY